MSVVSGRARGSVVAPDALTRTGAGDEKDGAVAYTGAGGIVVMPGAGGCGSAPTGRVSGGGGGIAPALPVASVGEDEGDVAGAAGALAVNPESAAPQPGQKLAWLAGRGNPQKGQNLAAIPSSKTNLPLRAMTNDRAALSQPEVWWPGPPCPFRLSGSGSARGTLSARAFMAAFAPRDVDDEHTGAHEGERGRGASRRLRSVDVAAGIGRRSDWRKGGGGRTRRERQGARKHALAFSALTCGGGNTGGNSTLCGKPLLDFRIQEIRGCASATEEPPPGVGILPHRLRGHDGVHLEVQVRTGRISRLAYTADGITCVEVTIRMILEKRFNTTLLKMHVQTGIGTVIRSEKDEVGVRPAVLEVGSARQFKIDVATLNRPMILALGHLILCHSLMVRMIRVAVKI